MTLLNTLAHFNITCIRNSSKKCDDDVISIRPKYSSEYDLEYDVHHVVGYSQSPREYQHKSVTSIANSAALVSYVETLVDLLYYDADPFPEIQFDIPGLPTILIKVDMLDIVTDRILSHLRHLTSTANAWPMNVSSVPKQSKNEVKVKEECFYTSTPKKGESTVYARDPNFRQHLFFDEDNSVTEINYEF